MVGASHPHELVQRSIALGYGSLGITDFDGVYGIARAYRDLQTLKKDSPQTSLRLRYGAELHLEKDHDLPVLLQNTLILYALNHQGYFNLCRLITHCHRDGKTYGNLPLKDLLSNPVDGLIAIQPMRGVIRFSKYQNQNECRKYFKPLVDHFSGRFYFAVSRLLHQAEDRWMTNILALTDFFGTPYLPTQDAFFAKRQDKVISDLLHAIRHNVTLDEVSDQLFINSHRSLHSLPALNRLYSDIPGIQVALKHSHNLASSFSFDLDQLSYHYPREMLPDGYTPQRYLEEQVWVFAKNKFKGEIPENLSKLIRHELKLVEQLQFADYFLTVWDIVTWARKQDILCQGRGSAANSAICYVLGITAINPDQFDLLFERFISVERGDPPDIDVDFENARREEVIQYIYQRYGRKRAAMVCNVITFKPRGAIRFVGKALGVPEKIIDHTAKSIKGLSFRSNSVHESIAFIRQRYSNHLDPDNTMGHKWDLWPLLAEKVLLFPRFLGVHSGGFMLAEKDIDWLLPQEPATMPGRTVIQWSKEDIEGLGFFKIDILALGMLTAIKKCFELLNQHYGISLTLSGIPNQDTATYDMICRAETTGVFQIESTAQMSSLPQLQPRNFYDLVVQVAIIRPGPILAGVKHPYLRRRNGLEAVSYADPRLEPILHRTYGTIIFQEQLMRVAMAIGNFTAGEADEIRKNIGSFQTNTKIGNWVGKLIKEMINSGIQPEFIKEIMQQIQGFASYGFPESHAASFALLAYASSYLKYHYPAAFFTALLNSQPMGFYQPDTLIKTAKHCGVTVLPICIQNSLWDSTLEAVGDSKEKPLYAIRLGFHLVRGINKPEMLLFLANKQDLKKYKSLKQLVFDNPLSRTTLTALAAAGAFKILKMGRKHAIWKTEAAPYDQ
jgi:error-prone DNA polymerase